MSIRARVSIAGVCCLFSAAISDCLARDKASSSTSPPRLISGLGNAHHAVSTKNPKAQQFFDQGLNLVYGFNHDEAQRSFEHAAKLDPTLAMAWWGIALALGPNYNLPVDAEREKAAYQAVQKALALQENASQAERGYINALAFRYSNNPKADLRKLDVAYRDAMAKLVTRYPDDLDAATLYAESMMLLHPWQLWLRDGSPNEGTEEILAVLESVLKRDPNHLGANHYYIHAIEPSPHPERALASAARLEKLAPAAGHLMHMPSHIYSRVGNHVASARVNTNAVVADQKFINRQPEPGMEAVMLSLHNLHFLAYAHCMSGKMVEAKRAADKLAGRVQPHVKEMPMLEGFLPTPILILIAFERWNDILRLPAPDASLLISNAAWHFARAMAQANLGNTAAAEQERSLWQSIVSKIPPDTMVDEVNKIGPVFKVHGSLLSAAIARGRHDDKAAVDLLHQSVAAEDALSYSEPPPWYPPTRPMLGRMLLEMGRADEAEKVFRQALEKSPRYHRALTGLRDSLKAQKRDYEAEQVSQQLREAQKDIDAVSSVRTRRQDRR